MPPRKKKEDADERSDSGDDLDDDAGSASDASDDDSDDSSSGRSGAASPRSVLQSRILLLPSLWSGKPATIWFDYDEEADVRREEGRSSLAELHDQSVLPLYFKSDHTIKCLCGAFQRAGFKRLIKGSTFNVFWGHHLKEEKLQKLAAYQQVNHFPGSYGLGRKDYLWRNISRMVWLQDLYPSTSQQIFGLLTSRIPMVQARKFGSAYEFCAKTYLLPADREFLDR